MEENMGELIWGRWKQKTPIFCFHKRAERTKKGVFVFFPHIVSPIFSTADSHHIFLGARRLLLLLLFSFLIYKKKKYIYM